jgi:Nucleoporin Nup120/160
MIQKMVRSRISHSYNDLTVVKDTWVESQFHHGSFLTSLTSLIPTLHGTEPNGSDIVSMTSCPQPTDIAHVWTLSRDRTLRLWTAKSGCIFARSLSSSSTSRALTPIPSSQPHSLKTTLLDAEPQRLVRAFVDSNNDAHVLVFIPTPTSSISGGIFHLFERAIDQLVSTCTLECSPASVHCHLHDFTVVRGLLYALWDMQGQSRVDVIDWKFFTSEKSNASPEAWRYASYPPEQHLTPTYLDELLLTPGSMMDKFFEAAIRPGVFSPLTLRVALEQYTDACLSLPGAAPPQLATSYASLGENIAAIVGCTVSLTRDPHTGIKQHDRYWSALKRDWEGFIARCREVERSARWPLTLGVRDQAGDLIVIERERVGVLVHEDLPLRLHRNLMASSALEPQYSLLEILWTLRSKIGTRTMLTLENRLVDILHQEIAFPYADIVMDQAQRTFSRTDLDDGDDSWITGRLQSIDDLDHAVRYSLDVLGSVADAGVKIEEEEVELLLPDARSEWIRSLTASYVSTTVHARYELCLAVMTLLFFQAEELTQWDPSLLAEVFVVFRTLAMLRHVSRQPATDNGAQPTPDGRTSSPDDVVARMRNMHVTSVRPRSSLSYPLLHRLIAQPGDRFDVPASAHRFLDSTALLQSMSPAHATKFETLFCERIRLLGYHELTREMLAWLPRTPGVTYILARLWLDIGRSDDAASLLEGLAGRFGQT